jgi:vacuolar-type H+-ATPase subunit I/STV1
MARTAAGARLARSAAKRKATHKKEIKSKKRSRGDEAEEIEPGEYQVKEIFKRRDTKEGTEYLVKWKGYPLEEKMWVPVENMGGCTELIEAFATGKHLFSPSDDEETMEAEYYKENAPYAANTPVSPCTVLL